MPSVEPAPPAPVQLTAPHRSSWAVPRLRLATDVWLGATWPAPAAGPSPTDVPEGSSPVASAAPATDPAARGRTG